jgi:hypothetical protein
MVVKREGYLLHAHYPLIESAERQLSNKCTSEHREEVSDIVGHDCQHTSQSISLCGWIERTIWDLQKIANTCSNRHQSRSRKIGAESPRLNMLHWSRHDSYVLLKAVGSEDTSHGTGVIGCLIGWELLICNNNVSPLQCCFQRLGLEERLQCEDCAKGDSEDNEEYAGSGIGASARWSP